MGRFLSVSYAGRPEFAGATSEDVVDEGHPANPDADLRYVRVTAKCGCVWTGLVVARSGANSDGLLELCPSHDWEDDEG